MTKLKIAVTGGGNSGEYDISAQSSARVAALLPPEKYDIYLILIRGTQWLWTDKAGVSWPVDRNDFSLYTGNEKVHFDCVFNAIHGTPGEDGKLQGYFEMLGIPHTSCNSITSALTFNKAYCNQVVAGLGVKTSRSVHLLRPSPSNRDLILQNLKLPVFVKPNCGGSSVGMTKVNEASGLDQALDLAFNHDQEVLVEEFVPGIEITCGVYGSPEGPVALPLVQVVSKKEYFDFEAKYDETLADEILPAPIPEALAGKCSSMSCWLYEKLNCSGVVRFDYILQGEDFCFLEVNTVPGMTLASIVPKMALHAGFDLPGFYDLLISRAIKR